MHFPISIKQGSRVFHLLCEQIHKDKRVQRYKIWAKNDPDKYLILENNKPLIRDKLKLKERRIDWTLIEHTGPPISNSTLESYIYAIIDHYTPPDPPKKVEHIIPARNRKSTFGEKPGPTLGERNKKADPE
jgi:hypothetical protein